MGSLLFVGLVLFVSVPAVLAHPHRTPFVIVSLGFFVAAGLVNAMIVFDFPYQRELMLGFWD